MSKERSTYLFVSDLALLVDPPVANFLLLVQLAFVGWTARRLGLHSRGRLVVWLLVLLCCGNLHKRRWSKHKHWNPCKDCDTMWHQFVTTCTTCGSRNYVFLGKCRVLVWTDILENCECYNWFLGPAPSLLFSNVATLLNVAGQVLSKYARYEASWCSYIRRSNREFSQGVVNLTKLTQK